MLLGGRSCKLNWVETKIVTGSLRLLLLYCVCVCVCVQGKRGLTELGEINCQQCLLYKYVQQR